MSLSHHYLPVHLCDRRFHEDPGALFADALEYLDDGTEVADVEHRELQVDVSPMPDAVIEVLPAGQAVGVLLTGAHAVVQDTVRDGGPLGIL